MYLSIGRLLLGSIFQTREAWLTKFFVVIENCIHAQPFIYLQVLKESFISLGIAVLEYCILKESIDDKYCQLRELFECFFESFQDVLETFKCMLRGHDVHHVLIDFLYFIDIYLVCWSCRALIERCKRHDVHFCLVFQLYRFMSTCCLLSFPLYLLMQLFLFLLQ